jgi:hypothetical protein
MNRHPNTSMFDSIPPPTQITITTVNSADSDDSLLIKPFPAGKYDLVYSPETIITQKYPNRTSPACYKMLNTMYFEKENELFSTRLNKLCQDKIYNVINLTSVKTSNWMLAEEVKKRYHFFKKTHPTPKNSYWKQ